MTKLLRAFVERLRRECFVLAETPRSEHRALPTVPLPAFWVVWDGRKTGVPQTTLAADFDVGKADGAWPPAQ